MNAMRLNVRHSLIATALLSAFAAPLPAGAAASEQEIAELTRMLEEAASQLAAQRKALAEQEKALASQKRELEQQKRLLESLQSRLRNGEKPAEAARSQPIGPVGRAPENEPATPAQIAALTETRGVLTPKGAWVLEPALQYAQSSSNRVALLGFTILPAITIGVIDIRQVSRDNFFASLAARYGITNRLEVEAKVPYVWGADTTVSRPIGVGAVSDIITNTRGNGVGDVEFALRYQLNEGGGSQPYFVGNLRAKTRTGKGPLEVPIDPASNLPTELATGSGFWGVQPSVTAIFPSDPAVFFGNLSYLWNIKRNVGNFGQVDPGDAFGFNFGLGLALNDKASFSLGYDHSVIGKTKVTSSALQTIATRTHVGSLNLGYSYRLSEKTSVNLSVAAGLTDAAPDVQLTLRFPMSF